MKKDGKVERGFLSFIDLCKEYKEFRDKPENEWLKEFPNTTARLALRDVVHAYEMFFNKQNKYPKFKSKKCSPKMFKTRSDRFYIDGDKIRFEGLPHDRTSDISEMIDLDFNTPFKRTDNIKYIAPIISKDNLGNYWIGFSIKDPIAPLDIPKTEPIGVDVGIRNTLTLSTGEIFNRPNDKLKHIESRRKRVQKHVSKDINRRLEESKRTKTKYDDIQPSVRAELRSQKLKKLYKKEANIKNNFYHETAKNIVERNPEMVVLEDLDILKMQKDAKNFHKKYLRTALSNAGLNKMQTIIEQKCIKYGIPVVYANINYPSSQICSNCGHIQNIGNKPIYNCPNCGLKMDRDINAAKNLVSLIK